MIQGGQVNTGETLGYRGMHREINGYRRRQRDIDVYRRVHQEEAEGGRWIQKGVSGRGRGK